MSKSSTVFERIYICFDAMKKGFLAECTPFIGLDGCHLKGSYGGQLLCAVARNPNNQIYPLAFAVFEVECNSSWMWFLSNLLVDIEDINEHKWIFISDRQKGLIQTFEELLPGVEHRFCV